MLKNILQEVLTLLDKRELYNKISIISEKSDINTELKDLSSMEKDDVMLMIRSALFVVNSVTRNYIKNLTVERVLTDSEGKIYFDQLDSSIISVKDVSDSLNSPLVFSVFFDHIKTACKNQEVLISYYFENSPLDSIFDSFKLPLSLTNHIVALGVVCEYLTIKLLYSEASVFEAKFKSELEDAAPKRGGRNFPAWRSV